MTFQEAYNLVNEKKLVVAYTLNWQENTDYISQDMSDLTIHQDVICSAKTEEHKYDLLEEMGLPSALTEIVLLDGKNKEIARGEAIETRCDHVFLSIEELMDYLQSLLKRDSGTWTEYILDDC